eukprot:scaffold312148_cov50-Prasinocladus_malaysianus.AAC.1
MWDVFVRQCTEDESLLTQSNPLDTYVKLAVTSSVNETLKGSDANTDNWVRHACAHRMGLLGRQTVHIYWGNDKHADLAGGEGYVSVQNLAAGLGLCYLDKNSHLCIHPKFGS